MDGSLGTATGRLGLDTSGFDRGIDRAAAKADQFQNTAIDGSRMQGQLAQVGQGFNSMADTGTSAMTRLADSVLANEQNIMSLGRTMASVGGIVASAFAIPMIGGAKAAWDQVDSTEQATFAMRAYEKDGRKVDKLLQDLLAYSKSEESGGLFWSDELFESAQNMVMFGAETEKVDDYVKILSRSVGQGTGSWLWLNKIMGRVGATGKLTSDDFDNLAKQGYILDESMRGVDITYDELLTAMGKTIPQDVLLGQADTIRGRMIWLEGAFRSVGAALLGLDRDTAKFAKGSLGEALFNGLQQVQNLMLAMIPAVELFGKALGFVAQIIGKVIDAFLALPVPIQTAIFSVVGLGSALMVAGGTFLMLLPTMARLYKAMSGFASVTVIFGRVAAALRGVAGPLGIIGRFVPQFRAASIAARALGFAIVPATAALRIFGGVLRSILLGPIGAAAWLAYSVNLFGFRDAVHAGIDALRSFFSTVREGFGFFQRLGQDPITAAINSIAAALRGLDIGILDGIVDKMTQIAKVTGGVHDAVTSFLDAFRGDGGGGDDATISVGTEITGDDKVMEWVKNPEAFDGTGFDYMVRVETESGELEEFGQIIDSYIDPDNPDLYHVKVKTDDGEFWATYDDIENEFSNFEPIEVDADTKKAEKAISDVRTGIEKLQDGLEAMSGVLRDRDLDFLADMVDSVNDVVDVVDDVIEAFEDTWESMSQGENAVNWLSRAFLSANGAILALTGGDLSGWIGTVYDAFQRAAILIEEVSTTFQLLRDRGLDPVQAAIATVGLTFDSLFDTMSAVSIALSRITDGFAALRDEGFNPVSAALGAMAIAFPALTGMMSSALGVVENLIAAFTDFRDGNWGAGFDHIRSAAGLAWDAFREGISLLAELGGQLLGWILDVGPPVVVGWIETARDNLWNALTSAAGWIAIHGGQLLGWILEVGAPTVIGWLRDAGSNLWAALAKAAGWTWDGVLDLGNVALQVRSWVSGGIADVWDWLKNYVIGDQPGSPSIAGGERGDRKSGITIGEVAVNVAKWIEGEIENVWSWINDTAIPAMEKQAAEIREVAVDIGGWAIDQGEVLFDAIRAKVLEWAHGGGGRTGLGDPAERGGHPIENIRVKLASFDIVGEASDAWTAINDWIDEQLAMTDERAAAFEPTGEAIGRGAMRAIFAGIRKVWDALSGGTGAGGAGGPEGTGGLAGGGAFGSGLWQYLRPILEGMFDELKSQVEMWTGEAELNGEAIGRLVMTAIFAGLRRVWSAITAGGVGGSGGPEGTGGLAGGGPFGSGLWQHLKPFFEGAFAELEERAIKWLNTAAEKIKIRLQEWWNSKVPEFMQFDMEDALPDPSSVLGGQHGMSLGDRLANIIEEDIGELDSFDIALEFIAEIGDIDVPSAEDIRRRIRREIGIPEEGLVPFTIAYALDLIRGGDTVDAEELDWVDERGIDVATRGDTDLELQLGVDIIVVDSKTGEVLDANTIANMVTDTTKDTGIVAGPVTGSISVDPERFDLKNPSEVGHKVAGSIFTSVGNELAMGGGDMAPQMGRGISDAADRAAPAADLAGKDLAERFGVGAEDALPAAGERFSSALTMAMSGVEETAREAGNNIGSVLADALGGFTGGGEEGGAGGGGGRGFGGGGGGGMFAGLVTAAENAVNDVRENLQTITVIMTAQTGAWDAVLSGFAESSSSTVSNWSTAIYTDVDSNFASLMAVVRTGTSSMQTTIGNFVSASGGDVSRWTMNIFREIDSTFASLMGVVRTGTSSMQTSIGNFVSISLGDISRWATQFFRSVDTAMTNVMAAARTGMGSVTSTIERESGKWAGIAGDGISGVAGAITNAGWGAISAAQRLGRDIGEGLARGMEQRLDRIRNAANSMVREAERAANVRAQAFSPSRVFMRMGQNYGGSLADGIASMASAAGDAAAKIVAIIDRILADIEERQFDWDFGNLVDRASDLMRKTGGRAAGHLADVISQGEWTGDMILDMPKQFREEARQLGREMEEALLAATAGGKHDVGQMDPRKVMAFLDQLEEAGHKLGGVIDGQWRQIGRNSSDWINMVTGEMRRRLDNKNLAPTEPTYQSEHWYTLPWFKMADAIEGGLPQAERAAENLGTSVVDALVATMRPIVVDRLTDILRDVTGTSDRAMLNRMLSAQPIAAVGNAPGMTINDNRRYEFEITSNDPEEVWRYVSARLDEEYDRTEDV